MSTPEVDIYDDDYWRGFDGIMERRRWGLFPGMDRVDQLSRLLTRQADEDHERWLAAIPAEERERRERHQQRLRDLVLTAIQSDDVDDWRLVDELAFGPGSGMSIAGMVAFTLKAIVAAFLVWLAISVLVIAAYFVLISWSGV